MIIIVMGVSGSGSGKSTVDPLLAAKLNLPFKDADHFHLEWNVEKMRSEIPLNDDDRKLWGQKLNHSMKEWDC